MSKFVTTIPTTIAETIALLPPKSFVHSVTLKDNKIEIVWDNDAHKTPYTFPLECPVEKLKELADKSDTGSTMQGHIKAEVDWNPPQPTIIENISTVNDKVKVDKRTKEYKESLRNAQNPA